MRRRSRYFGEGAVAADFSGAGAADSYKRDGGEKLIDGLTSLTSPDAVRGLAQLSERDEARLTELRKLRRDFDTDDPKKLARDLTLRADRIETIAAHARNVANAFATENLAALPPLRAAAADAGKRLVALRDSMMTSAMLPGSGSAKWQQMWEAAHNYSAVAYPSHNFPHTGEGSRCLLCQQQLELDAIARFNHFAEYVTSTAQAEAAAADHKANAAAQKLLTFVIEPMTLTIAIEDLSLEDADAATDVANAISNAGRIQAELVAWWNGTGEGPIEGVLPVSPDAVLRIIASLRTRANELQSSSTGMTPEAQSELNELEARRKLGETLHIVLDAIERKKRVAAYGQCLDDVATNAITKKSTELTKRLVTDTLRKTF